MGLLGKKNVREQFIRQLQNDYINELQLSEQMKRHAEAARYRQYREKLLYLAEREKKHAEIIKNLIEKLGGEVPKEIPPVSEETNRNLFEALKRDFEMDHEDYWEYYNLLYEAEEEGLVDFLPTLNQLRDEEYEHRETLLFLLQKLNPYRT
jgi:rubrerythrin